MWQGRAQADAKRTPERGTRAFTWIFAASLTLHATFAAGLRANAAARPARAPLQKIDIEFAKPPPPPPPPEPQLPPPELARVPKVHAPKPVARVSDVKPKEVVEEPPPEIGSALPASDEGTLPPAPPGTGEPGLMPAAAPPPPPPPPPPPVIEPKEGANYLKNPRPPYPRSALREGWEGKVVLRVKVLPDGKVGGALVQKSAGHSVFDEAALDIVKSWTFVPATQGGKPIVGWVAVPFEFRLD